MSFSILNALKGINGSFEINRLVGGIGGLVYVIAANVFVGYEVFWMGKPFDVATYCLAFPSGIGLIVGGTGAAVALKDRNVATAHVTATTGSKPATPPNAAPQVQPELMGQPADDEVDLAP